MVRAKEQFTSQVFAVVSRLHLDTSVVASLDAAASTLATASATSGVGAPTPLIDFVRTPATLEARAKVSEQVSACASPRAPPESGTWQF